MGCSWASKPARGEGGGGLPPLPLKSKDINLYLSRNEPIETMHSNVPIAPLGEVNWEVTTTIKVSTVMC